MKLRKVRYSGYVDLTVRWARFCDNNSVGVAWVVPAKRLWLGTQSHSYTCIGKKSNFTLALTLSIGMGASLRVASG